MRTKCMNRDTMPFSLLQLYKKRLAPQCLAPHSLLHFYVASINLFSLPGLGSLCCDIANIIIIICIKFLRAFLPSSRCLSTSSLSSLRRGSFSSLNFALVLASSSRHSLSYLLSLLSLSRSNAFASFYCKMDALKILKGHSISLSCFFEAFCRIRNMGIDKDGVFDGVE